jgi:hypothetical protein
MRRELKVYELLFFISDSLEIIVVRRVRSGLFIDLKSSKNLKITFSRLEEEESAFLF